MSTATTFERGMSWYIYKGLERRFVNSLEYVALDGNHDSVWSERLAELLVRIGGEVTSFFEEMVSSPSVSGLPSVVRIQGVNRRKINDYRDAFDSLCHLGDGEVVVNHGLTPERLVIPFREFSFFGKDQQVNWWNSYNAVKHSYYQSHREATLRNTLESLAALFLLNTVHKESRKYLIWKRVIRSGDMLFPEDEGQGRSSLWSELNKSWYGVPQSSSFMVDCRAETPLFLHKYRIDPSA